MTGCNKYKVIKIYRPEMRDEKHIQDWLNGLYEHQKYNLIAVDGDYYIFERNAYISSITQEDNDYESH